MCDNSVLYAKQFRRAEVGEALNITRLTVPGVKGTMAGFMGSKREAMNVYHSPSLVTTCLVCVPHGHYVTMEIPNPFSPAPQLSGRRLVARFEQRYFPAIDGSVPEDRFRLYHGGKEILVTLRDMATVGVDALYRGADMPKLETVPGEADQTYHKGVPAESLTVKPAAVPARQDNNVHVPQRSRHNPHETVFAGMLNAARRTPQQPAVTGILLMAALAACRIIV